MTITDAVTRVLTHYADFTGRARRSEFWYYVLAYVLLSIVLNLLGNLTGRPGEVLFGVVSSLVGLALLCPSLAVGARRLHDTGRSGWWQLLGLIPCFGTIVLIVFFAQDSQPDNAYGPSPKGAGPGSAGPAGY
ncbi:DUF805 domain-containing protein [Nocardioides sp. GY 10127]|uniref:DUF805 domain-containing protein n=1 Tax=Nocardioides sp. GY 10127 TaxID=2569762 RepID=UPI0010A75A04|nr:DUF805 domain-containing protein [Nocardioides sp. GY 10127]TIC82889.1 DUF805 domain-containing protein [Nocardioides sp. GY 10127]